MQHTSISKPIIIGLTLLFSYTAFARTPLSDAEGYSPTCYLNDVSAEMIDKRRKRYGN
jgi:hypothetical protein